MDKILGMKWTLYHYLEDLGYSKLDISITLHEYRFIDQESKLKMKDLLDGKEVSDYSYRDFSVKSLIEKQKLNPVSAIIAISHLKQDYDSYSDLYTRPIKWCSGGI